MLVDWIDYRIRLMNQRKSEGNTSEESRTDSHQTQTNHDVVFQIENSQRNATMRRCETFRSCILIRTEFAAVALATNLFDKCLQLHSPPPLSHFQIGHIYNSTEFQLFINHSKTENLVFRLMSMKTSSFVDDNMWQTEQERIEEEQIKRNLKMKLECQCILVLNNWWLLPASYTSEYQMNITRVHVVVLSEQRTTYKGHHRIQHDPFGNGLRNDVAHWLTKRKICFMRMQWVDGCVW